MYKIAARIVKPVACAAIIAASGLYPDASGAAPIKPQPQSQVFAPACAVRPRCVVNICVRSGRCSRAGRVQVVGCLLYACQRAPR